MKLYIWQNNPGNKWYIHLEIPDPLGRQLRGITSDLFTRTTLCHPDLSRTATFRMNPRNGVGELFMEMSAYQFLLEQDYRTDSKENCILRSTGRWLIQNPKLEGIHII